MTLKDELPRLVISDSIGIVCPLFEFEIPNLVKDFIQGSSFETDYFYRWTDGL